MAGRAMLASAERVGKLAEADSVYGALLTRLMTGFARVVREIPETEVTRLLAEDSALETALAVLERPDAIEALRKQDPLSSARIRGLRVVESLLSAEEGTLTADETSRVLGITRQAVDKRRKSGRLMAVQVGRGFRYPAWQIQDHRVIPGLEKVLQALRDQTPWAQLVFMLNENDRLNGRKPLTVLHQGAIEEVLAAAGVYGNQGAA